MNRVSDEGWQRLPSGTGIKLVACHHKFPFQPSPVGLAFRLDSPAASAQAIDRDVAQRGRESSLIQPLEFGSIQNRAEAEPGRTACKMAGEGPRRKAGQLV